MLLTLKAYIFLIKLDVISLKIMVHHLGKLVKSRVGACVIKKISTFQESTLISGTTCLPKYSEGYSLKEKSFECNSLQV